MNACEVYAEKGPGATSSPILPINFDLLYDWMWGTGSDLNMARMVGFYEANQEISEVYS